MPATAGTENSEPDFILNYTTSLSFLDALARTMLHRRLLLAHAPLALIDCLILALGEVSCLIVHQELLRNRFLLLLLGQSVVLSASRVILHRTNLEKCR